MSSIHLPVGFKDVEGMDVGGVTGAAVVVGGETGVVVVVVGGLFSPGSDTGVTVGCKDGDVFVGWETSVSVVVGLKVCPGDGGDGVMIGAGVGRDVAGRLVGTVGMGADVTSGTLVPFVTGTILTGREYQSNRP